VMLNKGNAPARVTLNTMLEPGEWRDAFSGERVVLAPGRKSFSAEVPAHGLRVFFKDAPLSSDAVLDRARKLMRNRSPR
jgi:cyclomaltodextrin glucanotransferase